MSLIIFIIIFVSAGEVSKYMNSPVIKSMLEISSLVIILSALEMMQQVKLTLELNFKKQALITLSSILLSGLIGIVLAVFGFGVWSLVFQQLSNALFRVVFSFIFVRWFPLRVFDIEELRKLFGFGNKLLLSNLLDVAFNYVYIL
ncbi:oligosaccharide flippase family protein, partial [Photobacterium damselae]